LVRLSEGVEWGLHCCTLLALLPQGQALPASRLAEFHGVPGPYLAKALQALSRQGVVESVPGARGGYRLARAARAISLLEVVLAVEGEARAFRCAEIRQRGPSAVGAGGYPRPCGIARAMWRAEEAWRGELARQTVADLVDGLAEDVDPRAAAKAVAWLQEALR
jgi:Rrf2 family protein